MFNDRRATEPLFYGRDRVCATGNPHGCRARSSGRVKSLFSPMFCEFAPHGAKRELSDY